MRKFAKYIFVLAFSVMCCQCVYDFDPTDFWEVEDVIVIEGDILVGEQSYFKVSKTIALSDTVHNRIMNASVWVEDEAGKTWRAVLENDGRYMANTSDLDVNGRYKLCVEIPNRGQYESALLDVMMPPPIDSVSYTVADDKSSLSIFVTTHDSENPDNKYYKWNYEEDWEFTSKYMPELEYIPGEGFIPGVGARPGTMKELSVEERKKRYYCWNKDHEGKIVIASAEKMSENIIYKEKLKTISNSDYRLSYLYSILVKQTALNKEGYAYWETLMKNTYETGGLFAPQPSELRGNIYSVTDKDEFVLGYINASSVSKERLFINCREMSIFRWPWQDVIDIVGIGRWPQEYRYGHRPVNYYRNDDDVTVKDTVWWTTQPRCVDCRLMGTNNKPSFWPVEY